MVLSPAAEAGVRRDARAGAPPATAYPSGSAARRPLDQALIGTGFGYETPVRARQAGAVARMLPQVRDIRRSGVLRAGPVRRGRRAARRLRRGGAAHLGPRRRGLVAAEAGARVEVWTTAAAMELVVAAPEDGWSAFSALVRDCGYLDDSSML